MATKEQIELIKIMRLQVLELEVLYEINYEDDKKTDKKLEEYRKKYWIAENDYKHKGYIPNEEIRVKEIWPIMHSEERMQRDKNISRKLKELKKTFEAITNNWHEIETNAYTLYLKIKKIADRARDAISTGNAEKNRQS